MPLYDYMCRECDREFSKHRAVERRNDVRCECGGETEILILGAPSFHKFSSYFDFQLGETVHSRVQKKALLKSRGLMSVDDTEYDDVVKQAEWNKDYEAKKKHESRKREFCENVWPKYNLWTD